MTTWVWELFRDTNGNIPTELQQHFYHLLSVKPTGIQSALTEKQAATLQRKVKFLCEKYPASFGTDHVDHFDDGFYELRFIHDGLSYRYTFAMKNPQTFVFLDVFEKRYNGATKSRDKARTIKRLDELQVQIKAEKAVIKASKVKASGKKGRS